MTHDHQFIDGTYCGGELIECPGPERSPFWPHVKTYVRCADCGLTGIILEEADR